MIVTVFRSRLMPGLQAEYVALVEEVRKEVETIPGYISHKGFWADDGERVTIVEFADEAAQQVWRTNRKHIEAQRLGRQKYYQTYDIQVCSVLHESHFKRDTGT